MLSYWLSLAQALVPSRTSGWRLLVSWCCALAAAAPGAHAADIASAGPLMQPRAVVLHVHADIADQRFIPALTQRLEKGLAPPVRVLATDVDLAPLRPAVGKIDAALLAEYLIRGIDWTSQPQTVQVLLVRDDMRLRPANFNFAVSNGTPATPHHVIVVSLARLQDRAIVGGEDQDPAMTAERVAKMVLKNVARVAGYAHSDRCVFGFPRNLGDLDAMPAGYCEPDLTILISAGIARPLTAGPGR